MASRGTRSEGPGSYGSDRDERAYAGSSAGPRQDDISRYSRANYAGRSSRAQQSDLAQARSASQQAGQSTGLPNAQRVPVVSASASRVRPATGVGQKGPRAGAQAGQRPNEGGWGGRSGRNDRRGASHPSGTPLSVEEYRQQYSRDNAHYTSKEARRSNRGKKVAIGVLSALLIVLIGAGGAFAYFVNKVDKQLSGTKTAEEQEAIQGVLVDRANSTDPFYMLLLGSDARADDTSMGARSDTAIVARIDPKSNRVTLISIPRDTMIYIDGSGPYKFNAAYSFRGTAGAIQAASELLDVDISHYAEVNFESLVSLVDTVGGVEVDVPVRINDWMAGDVIIEAGVQTLDGEAALVFARSRAYSDGDFTRTSNQRALIEALASKVLTLPVEQMPSVIQEAAKSVTTDLSVTEIISLAVEFTDDDGELTIYSAMVPSTTDMVGGISYVVTDKTGLKEMMRVVEEGGDPSTVTTYGATGSVLDDQ